jgi:hypothetical protein
MVDTGRPSFTNVTDADVSAFKVVATTSMANSEVYILFISCAVL